MNHFEKLYSQHKQKIVHDKSYEKSDNITFKPEINNKYQLNNRNLADVDIGEYLYSKHEIIKKNKEDHIKQLERETKEKLNTTKVNSTSINLFEQLKLKRFGQIFRLLDSDNHNEISAE